ncbi:hypothetical protein CCACVL1_26038 [Corchorus capsularis]|uniref:Homeobox domain-containing protein n=1 Tax=Corchorus capsularis TaxID=210143 RepID=A0A1R3GG60_COCAP|nr:hypothetical protein CCACVL1_26038 [Corchorus capsularis]
MEPQQQHVNEDSSGSGKGSFLCRQSSTRWTPTTDQIRILKDLYYNNGVRSPTAEQIQKISARLRQYGKIEGKNVFYWFQNHKARERQKKRFTTTTTTDVPMQRPTTVSNNAPSCWKPDDHNSIHNNNKYPNLNPGYSPASPNCSTGVITSGQMGNYGYGSMTMEKSFRNCSISCGSSTNASEVPLSHNFGWVGFDPSYASSYTVFEKKKFIDGSIILEEEDEEEDQETVAPHIQTLPLFPMRDMKPEPDSCYSGWYRTSDHHDGYVSARASLELSLNSCTGNYSQGSF